ncbi:hypothetical protein KM043_016135 [Ampulex compressa]|nr:hypothetical protein KM043_016135 [Ampulex compressa]
MVRPSDMSDSVHYDLTIHSKILESDRRNLYTFLASIFARKVRSSREIDAAHGGDRSKAEAHSTLDEERRTGVSVNRPPPPPRCRDFGESRRPSLIKPPLIIFQYAPASRKGDEGDCLREGRGTEKESRAPLDRGPSTLR